MHYNFPLDLIFVVLFYWQKGQESHHGLELELSLDV